MQNPIFRPALFGTIASLAMFNIYFFILTLVSGWSFALVQFYAYWYFVVSLVMGFGILFALYSYIKDMVQHGHGMGKVVGVSGATSTMAMVACCAHYLVNLVPILGVTGFITLVAQYQVKLFWLGILLNLAGIGLMIYRIYKFKHA